MAARPAVKKGAVVPEPSKLAQLKNDPAKLQEHADKAKAWIQAGMAADAKK